MKVAVPLDTASGRRSREDGPIKLQGWPETCIETVICGAAASCSVSEIAPEHLHFRPAHTLRGPIRQAFLDEQAKILALLPQAEVLHTGATSVLAALTRGDLDIHVRVSPAEFSGARHALARVYASYRTEMWTAGFATFVAPDAPIATGVALTAIGGEHDQRFVLAWDRLRRDPQLLEEHNALKLKYEDAPDAASYEAAKSAFFSALVVADTEPPDLPSLDDSQASPR